MAGLYPSVSLEYLHFRSHVVYSKNYVLAPPLLVRAQVLRKPTVTLSANVTNIATRLPRFYHWVNEYVAYALRISYDSINQRKERSPLREDQSRKNVGEVVLVFGLSLSDSTRLAISRAHLI